MSAGVVATVKSKLDIVEIIGESVPLRKAGATYKGLCPFHGEKTPSFVVTPARQSWHCFGCGLGGDVFSFVMQREGIDFPEALKRLAARAGVELDERTSREDARRKRLRDALEAAIAFYHRVLTDTRHGQPALDYLRGRGFTDETISTFQLGWAPGGWETLTKNLRAKRGATDDDLEGAGLAVRGRRGTLYDRFRARIIFPIRDVSGHATGLGGRILERAGGPGQAPPERDRGPKYLNSPATPLFDKSRSLYLVDRARGAMRKSGRAVIVEGYTDALMAHQAGFQNVVAALGTALTAAQVELVTRYAPAIALAYDVDPAGQSAGTFGATELTALIAEIQRSGARIGLTEVGVVRLPAGKDPDEVIRDDRLTWEAATAEPQPIMDYLVEYFATRHDPRTVQGRKRLVEAVAPTLRRIGDPVERDAYVQALARRAGVEERTIMEVLQRPDSTRPGSEDPGATGHGTGRFTVDAVIATRDGIDPLQAAASLDPVEQELLGLLLRHPAQRAGLAGTPTPDAVAPDAPARGGLAPGMDGFEGLAPEALVTTPARELWRALLDADRAVRRASPDQIGIDLDPFLRSLDPELEAIARGLLLRAGPRVAEDRAARAVDQCLIRLRLRRVSEEIDFLRADLAELQAGGGADMKGDPMVARIRNLERERAELDHRAAAATMLTRSPAHQTNSNRSQTPVGGPA
ncbi:MAG: DNA primase [Candidatus Limnocylindrales bacterium]